MSDRIYYQIDEASPVMAVIWEAEKRKREFHAASESLKQEFHAAEVWSANRAWVIGLEFRGDIPQGWRPTKRGYAVPDRRVKAGRELAQRLKEMPQAVDARGFSGMLTEALKDGDYTHFACEECRLLYTVLEQHGEIYILSVPAQCKVTPPGCTELKMSEYWKIREEAVNVARSQPEQAASPE